MGHNGLIPPSPRAERGLGGEVERGLNPTPIPSPLAGRGKPPPIETQLARRLTLFDATMIVMGGIIGAGIFSNPYVVAQLVHSTSLILGVWIAGGLIALAGAFIYAELSSQVSETGGQYVYLRDAMHPVVGFVYGWSMLFVIQTGAMAAVALIFANHVFAVAGMTASEWSAALLAASALILLAIVNCIGVRAGTLTQNTFMILKLVAIAALVVIGLALATPASTEVSAVAAGGSTWQTLIAFGAALIPAQFAYGGWQTSCYVAGEVREPRKTLPRALLIGVVGVIVVYLSVNFVCVYVLGSGDVGQDEDARVSNHGAGARRQRRALHRRRHRNLDDWVLEPEHADRAASLFRDG